MFNIFKLFKSERKTDLKTMTDDVISSNSNSNSASDSISNSIYKYAEEADEFVRKMEELGYFKYAAEEDVESLKEAMWSMIGFAGKEGTLDCELDEDTFVPKDYRWFLCDGEDVFEMGGIPDLLKYLQPAFDKMNFKIEIGDYEEELDEKERWSVSIVINGRKYEIFKDWEGYGWGEAPMRIADIINREMNKQGIDENIYLIAGGNEGRLVFLSAEQYKYAYGYFTDPIYKPLEVNEWGRVQQTAPLPDYS